MRPDCSLDRISSRLRNQTRREFVYRPLQLQKRGQFLIGTHDETPSVAVGINNPACAPLTIDSGHPAQTPAGFS